MQTRESEIQQWNEQDVLGSMLIEGDMTNALLKGLATTDLKFLIHKTIYRQMIDNQQFGLLNMESLLESSDRTVGKHVLHIMDVCLTTNAAIKCDWLIGRAVGNA